MNVTAVRSRQVVLAPLLDPFHRPLQLDAGFRTEDLFQIDRDLAAEAAPDLGRDHPHLVFRHTERLDESATKNVRRLCRAPEGKRLVAGVVLGDNASRLNWIG